MTGFWVILGDWGYALAAALFTAIAIVTSRQGSGQQSIGGQAGGGQGGNSSARQMLIVALVITALWALYGLVARSVAGLPSFSGGVAETARNGAWLTVSWLLLRGSSTRPGVDAMPAGARPVFYALLLALGCQLCLDMVVSDLVLTEETVQPLVQTSWLLRASTALGAIFLLHGLYARLDRERSSSIGWLGCALTILWAYEFNHYLLAWLSDGRFIAIGQMRGVVMTLIAPLIMLGTGQRERRAITLSRRATYHTVTVALAILYAVVLLAMIVLIRVTENVPAQLIQLGAVFALSVFTLILLPSAPFRAWLRVEVAKHLFTHRYDYRQEWMRFADTLGSDGTDGGLPPRRAARAVAQLVCAPGALLMMRGEDGTLAPEADWNWPEADAPGHVIDAGLAERLQASGWIADILDPADPLADALPRWMAETLAAWTLVPLIHHGILTGAVLLARPPGRGGVDWEDLDMLRVVARQLAVTLNERRQQQALAEGQRFDEFNRRFAFILHDIKNMVSQMSLLAANAERHAENPAFRADMVLTLRETADRMNDLIARLARPDPVRAGDRAVCDMGAVVRDVTGRGAARGRVQVSGTERLMVRGDAGRLTQAIGHLVQNALDATLADGAPVRLALTQEGDRARVGITDRGCGMSAEFVRDGLFRPFASTKAMGFGLGAHEARSLIMAMGGQLSVTSREGEGTEFTLSLPLVVDSEADALSPLPHLRDRKTG
ncbi:PEP-CTERM system histidine kinase PrsK [Sphingobium sufflavum]|uniref:XrtA/PEP-CTERM system histidine kinase PrsK n=1 Tax=Sphingobium sufflavum TaxID=1129547 RepID=UPI001F1BCCDC|nr:XrtA/PEP-CTERM system histidine kinase PrsK [Sphingobium sufflavum]MCE7794988.1 PEP-CTERM system histidine kinase PrsK [Sphingobium sufflavum]